MQSIQLLGITPQQLQEAISFDIKNQLEALKENFEPKTPTEYLTRKEAADLLKIQLSTLHKWVNEGKLKSYGLGGRIYFKRSEIEDSLIPLQ